MQKHLIGLIVVLYVLTLTILSVHNMIKTCPQCNKYKGINASPTICKFNNAKSKCSCMYIINRGDIIFYYPKSPINYTCVYGYLIFIILNNFMGWFILNQLKI